MHKNLHGTPTKISDQYKKIFCAYHKAEFLTNFCVDKNCLMPLCPSCIVDHTQQHYRQHSKPLYMNLHQALHDVKQSCLNNISQFENFAQKLRQLSEFKKKLVQEVHSQLVEHKQNIYMQIQRQFMQYEHDVYKLIVKDYDQERLYRQDDINQYQYKVQDTINQLYDKIGLIKGQQCLVTLIMYYGEERDRITQIRNECQKFMYHHDNLRIQTSLNESAIKKQLQHLFENVIQISKGKKFQRSRNLQSRTPQKYNYNLNNSISQSRRSKIFNESGSKINSPPKSSPVSASRREQKSNIRYESAFR